MADSALSATPWCSCFFLYDRSKVQEEGDLTRAGIYYYYPQDTPLDQQELVCGQLAGVSRCVSEISSSPLRLLRLRKTKYAICMKDNFLWALRCASDLPDVSVCEFLRWLIDLFCFYSGPVGYSYQVHSRSELALCWTRCLFHLQGGATELHHIFSCVKTIDHTHIDPLLLLKAALILQACQRCPLVLAGCILYRSKVVSTQMSPVLTMKLMIADESDLYPQNSRMSTSPSQATPTSSTMVTPVFLTQSELHSLHSQPGNRFSSLYSPVKPHLLSHTDCTMSPTHMDSAHSAAPPNQTPPSSSSSLSDEACFRPCRSSPSTPGQSSLAGRDSTESHDQGVANGVLSGDAVSSLQESDVSIESKTQSPDLISDGVSDGVSVRSDDEGRREGEVRESDKQSCGAEEDSALEPMLLYQHRVRDLVLVLLVEPDFSTQSIAQQEVYHSSLASLNGLEAHLRALPVVTPPTQGQYSFSHYDCIQKTLKTNVYKVSAGSQDVCFVKAASLLHSHFSNSNTLQDAIIRNSVYAAYGTRTTAHETFFLQQGGAGRNSGIPNPQDTAFSLPSKARHRLLKHGVNLL